MTRKFIQVDAHVLLRPAFSGIDSFMGLVEHFLKELPEYKPNKWNTAEPISKEFDLVTIRQSLLEEGWFNFDWKRSSLPKGWGKFGQRAKIKARHARHALYVTAQDQNQVAAVCRYLHSCSTEFGVDYAYVDSLGEGYKDYGVTCDAAPYRTSIMIPSVKLHQNLPDILWSQVFGPPYVRLFGLDKLLDAPAYKIEQLGPETVYIQLSESLFDIHERYREVDAIRQRVKTHLDNNIFFKPENPEGHIYCTPDFQFSPQ